MKELDLGLTKGLLNSVSSILKDTSKVQAEQSAKANEQLSAKFKMPRPLSMEDAKVASYAAKAPERRITDTISALYAKSVAENNEQAKAESDAIKKAYAARGGVKPITEATLTEEGVHVLDNEGETHVHIKDAKNVKEVDDAVVQHLVNKHKMSPEQARKTYREVSNDTPFHHDKPEKDHPVDVVRSKAAHAKQVGDYVHSMVSEALSPKQKKHLDKNKNNKIDAHDFEIIRSRKSKMATDVSDETILDGGTIAELKDTPGNSYDHQCAIHVKHASMGEGRTLFSQHAKPDAEGQIAWYDVMFAEGIEKKVPTTDLEILVSESHMNHKKKKKM